MTTLTQCTLRLKKLNRAIIAVGLAGCLGLSASINAQEAQQSDTEDKAAFAQWLQQFRADAIERGISANTLDEIIPTIEPQRRVIQADRSQAEFVDTYENYLRRVSPTRINLGKDLLAEQGDMINSIAKEYGVQGRFVAAILGMESNYGTYPITEPMFNVLATLAYDSRRGDQFRNQLFAAFEIVDKGFATVDMMKSSWAGALGAPQFMPDSYLRRAVDQDGDGKRDLWTMGPDVIGSVANYLKATNWKDDQTWGRIVSLPPGGEQSLPAPQNVGMAPDATCRAYTSMGVWRRLDEWQELGVRRADGSDLPTRPLPAALIIGDEGDDQGYLVYRNFCSLLRYNPSFKYALGVSLLSDAIAEIEK
ncbi:MAG: lytic murein transglycosylase [Pseudohongiellaceae bacterium]|nr:lytic murein transglycosylase [Pseudohongiellaceae bacterium]